MTTTLTKREPRKMRPFEPFQSMRDEMEYLWSQLVGERPSGWLAPPKVPAMDLSETADAVEVRIDVPGFKADEINVQLSNNVLTVSGEHVEEEKTEEKTYHRMERRFGSFSRSVALPAPVDEARNDAQYRDGVLTGSMPKTQEAKSRKIKVKG
jgi:HSP20 family protein